MALDQSNIQLEVAFQCNTQLHDLAEQVTGLDWSALPSSEQWQSWLQCWLSVLQPEYSPIDVYEVSLYLTTDAEIQQLNADYRQIDRPTDVLAFAIMEGDTSAGVALRHRPPDEMLATLPLPLGDIVISVETAQRQAIAAQHSLTKELVWLAAHGLLHLLGWDHPDETHLQRMLDQQDTLLQIIQLSK
ncbi:MAG: rRNA maturation RNase YbeY [Cyanothece sp. SIO2G6]|nr:rRNA maturation RNase YbeY [Cyanothece sp. SIO2G6]